MPVAARNKQNASASTHQSLQTGIQRFTRVSKTTRHATDCQKPIQLQEPDTASEVANRKRGLSDASSVEDVKRPRIHDQSIVTPRKPKANLQSLPTPDTTPTKPIKWASLESPTPSIHTSSTPHPDTPPASPSATTRNRPFTTLPNELYDLLQLNAALLQALSLQFAHTGSVAPVDVRILRPSVTKIWGKRKATLDDIRRCLAVLHTDSSGPVFHLYDYERGRICIERSEEHNTRAVIARHVDEDRLNEHFEQTLTRLWHASLQNSTPELPNPAESFIADLPLEPIVLCPSLTKIKPRLLQGQRRLEDLKGISLERRTAEKVSVSTISQAALARKAAPVGDRSQSLLARLKAKADLAASQPAPATKEDLQRKSALSRLHEIVPILAVPSSKASRRTTFALPLLVQTVQGSARNAMAKEEIVYSLELLCGLGWGGAAACFVEMVHTGGVVAVVVDRTRRPVDWQARLDDAVEQA